MTSWLTWLFAVSTVIGMVSCHLSCPIGGLSASDDLIYRKYRYIVLYCVVEKNTEFFDISRYLKSIAIYCDICDNITIFSRNYSPRCMTGKKDYKGG